MGGLCCDHSSSGAPLLSSSGPRTAHRPSPARAGSTGAPGLLLGPTLGVSLSVARLHLGVCVRGSPQAELPHKTSCGSPVSPQRQGRPSTNQVLPPSRPKPHPDSHLQPCPWESGTGRQAVSCKTNTQDTPTFTTSLWLSLCQHLGLALK